MGRAPSHKNVRYGATPNHKQNVCSQQFPECPETPNHTDCHACPLWGTGASRAYQQKETDKNLTETL